MTRPRLVPLAAALLLTAVSTTAVLERAEACGGFFRKRLSNERDASLAYEQIPLQRIASYCLAQDSRDGRMLASFATRSLGMNGFCRKAVMPREMKPRVASTSL